MIDAGAAVSEEPEWIDLGGDEFRYTTEAEDLLGDLCQVVEQLRPNAREFVYDMVDRFEMYGDHTFVSTKQLSWLRSLHAQYC